MNLKFWKKKAPAAADDGEADDRTVAIPREAEAAEAPEEGSVRPGLLARVRNALSALRKPRGSDAEAGDAEAETPGRDKHAVDRRDAEEPVIVPVRNLKKRLIIGGMLSAAVLVLAGIGFTAWTLLAPKHAEPQKPSEAAAHNGAAGGAKTPDSAAMQAQIAALKAQNAKMHSELEAMKKTGQGDAPAAAGAENGATKPASGEVLVFSGKDPKAGAAALKQAIEEMNAESEGRKPRKPAP